jgi:ABC-2 type transport system permease protein
MGKNKIGIIIGREFSIRVKKKSFILSTILTPLLFAGLMVVPALMAMYSDNDIIQNIKVVDESGIVMPYLENTDNIRFEQIKDKTVDQLKEEIEKEEYTAVIGISKLDSSNNLSITSYSMRQLNIDLLSTIKKEVRQAVEDYKLKAYNIPNLDKVLEDVKSEVKMSTYTLDKNTGEAKESKVEIYMAIGYVASFMIYMFIFMFGSMVMRSVIEEKSTRIVEVIVSSVKPFQLMMGKIIGVAAVALTQFFIWILLTFVIVAGVTYAVGADSVKATVAQKVEQTQAAAQVQTGGSTANSDDMATKIAQYSGDPDKTIVEERAEAKVAEVASASDDESFNSVINSLKQINYASIIICFVVYFILGYLLYASMFAAVGSAVDNETDTQQLILPITIPLIIGLFIMINTFQHPDNSLSFWGSIIPFTSPMVMMARISYGVPTWQLILSVGLLVGTFIVFAFISGKIYRIGILMYGKKATWKDIFKWLRR